MTKMFANCINLIDIDLSDFKYKNVIKMDSIFLNCINLNFNSFNSSQVEIMDNAFENYKI